MLQSTNRPIDQSTNRPIDQSTNRPIDQSTNRPIDQSTNRPIISFIVPIYNVEQYLVSCLESVLAQSIVKEIILVNDGSTDHSLQIALDYVQKYHEIKLIHYNKNHGLSYARNQALKVAQGDYIYFVDSDDYLSGNHLGDILSFAQNYHADIIRVQGQFVYEYQQNKEVAFQSYIPNNNDVHSIYQLSGETCLNLLVQHNWIPGVCWTLMKREFIQQNQLYFLENTHAEDQLFYVQLLTCQSQVKVLEFPHIIYNYRKRANSITTTVSEQYCLDHCTIIDNLLQWKKSHDFSMDVQSSIDEICNILYQTAYRLYLCLPIEQQNKLAHYFKAEHI